MPVDLAAHAHSRVEGVPPPAVVIRPVTDRPAAHRRSAAWGVGVQEVGDDGAELFAGVFLQEVAGGGDDRMLDARRAAPGTARRRTGAIAPVIGSRSLKAARNGLSQADSRRQAGRLASLAGSSGRVGTRPGIARGPAIYDWSGNGAS